MCSEFEKKKGEGGRAPRSKGPGLRFNHDVEGTFLLWNRRRYCRKKEERVKKKRGRPLLKGREGETVSVTGIRGREKEVLHYLGSTRTPSCGHLASADGGISERPSLSAKRENQEKMRAGSWKGKTLSRRGDYHLQPWSKKRKDYLFPQGGGA